MAHFSNTGSCPTRSRQDLLVFQRWFQAVCLTSTDVDDPSHNISFAEFCTFDIKKNVKCVVLWLVLIVLVSPPLRPSRDVFSVLASFQNQPHTTLLSSEISMIARPPLSGRNHFGNFGTLADIALMKDKYTGHPRGFGFIKFEDVTGLSSWV